MVSLFSGENIAHPGKMAIGIIDTKPWELVTNNRECLVAQKNTATRLPLQWLQATNGS